MVSRINSVGIKGIDGYSLSCECDLLGGLPAFDIVGLPDAAVKESRERVRSAISNSGFEFPMRRITVNLAPADTKKAGAVYDLPILLAILCSSGQFAADLTESVFLGEVSLDGKLRPINGALPAAVAAGAMGAKKIYLPLDNATEAALAGGPSVYGLEDVKTLIAVLGGEMEIESAKAPSMDIYDSYGVDFADVKGQDNAKRGLEIAAAGGHNVLMCGPPGSGKSMLAKRLPSVLPEMTLQQSLETTKIYSVAGLTSRKVPLISHRPFRAPHHTTSAISLIGGGSDLHPGEVSLAHNGVLFLDELTEFAKYTIDVLRQPIEDGTVTISRASGTVNYPCRFMLVGAMNPCPCGWHGHPSGRCICSSAQVKTYKGRISGPMRDRMDIFIDVPEVKFSELTEKKDAESSKEIRARVNKARAVQARRFAERNLPISCNAHMPAELLNNCCELGTKEKELMRAAFSRLGLTARSYDRLLRISRTIADLDGAEHIETHHLAEALRYRSENT